jgi:hypothetical protein
MVVDESDESEEGGKETWISPRYCRINVPGFRSFAAKSPCCPFAGWEGVSIEVILTSGEGPKGVSDGMHMASLGCARRDKRCSGVRLEE